jgi:hypothetical protein
MPNITLMIIISQNTCLVNFLFLINSLSNQKVAYSDKNLNFLKYERKPNASVILPHTHQSTVHYTLPDPNGNFVKTHLLTPDLRRLSRQNDRTVHSLFFRRRWVIIINSPILYQTPELPLKSH